jgi:methyl-accepting chemotaxis protein
MSIVKKIAVLTVAIVVTAVSVTTFLCMTKMRQELVRVATASQESRLNTFWELLRQKGAFRIVDNRLMAGDYVINDNNELPDKIVKLCGGTATIFMNDERVATTVMQQDGSRAVGTRLKGPAYDAVFGKGQSYRGVAPILNVPYFTAYDPIRDASGKVIGVLYVGVKTEEFLKSFEHTRAIVIAIAIGLVLLASSIAVIVTRRLLTPIGEAVTVTEAVAKGDLTVAIPTGAQNEAGKLLASLQTMVNGLGGMVSRVSRSAGELQNISTQLSAESAQVVQAAKHQHGKLEETSAYVEKIAVRAHEVGRESENLARAAAESSASILEMTASAEEVALNADKLTSLINEVTAAITQTAAAAREIGENTLTLVDSSLATSSSVLEMEASIRNVKANALMTAGIAGTVEQDAQKGVQAMTAMRQGMNDIRISSRITNEVVGTLAARSHEIGAITSVIDDIASRTSLLALNAAIIASQAGIHGRGFAVVADEIKTLAAKTASSTGEIADLIKGVQKEAERAAVVIRETDGKIAVGEDLSLRSSHALEKIVTGISTARSHIDGIALATEEQAKGTGMIREAMDRVTEMTEKIGLATREQAGAEEAVMAAAQDMKGLASQFRSATREQSKVGSSISKAMVDVSAMSSRIETACAEQAQGSRQIAAAVTAINSDADRSLQAATLLETGAKALTEQVDILQRDTEAFRLQGRAAGRPGHGNVRDGRETFQELVSA